MTKRSLSGPGGLKASGYHCPAGRTLVRRLVRRSRGGGGSFTRRRKASGYHCCLVAGLVGIIWTGVTTRPILAHHSFAMYDQSTTKTLTGKLVRYIPGANHAQLIFDVLDSEGKPVMQNGKPVQWGVETGSAAALARQGVAPKTFPEGTIFTVTLYPLRDGRTFGAMAGMLIKCGATMPAGGCTKATGEVLISGDNDPA